MPHRAGLAARRALRPAPEVDVPLTCRQRHLARTWPGAEDASEEGAAQEPGGEVVVYESPDGAVRVEVLVGEDTVWLTQRQMAGLFDPGSRNVGINIQNAYGEGELVEGATAKDSFVVRSVGGRQVHRRVQDHNLDVAISVGHTWKSMTLGSILVGSRVALAGVLRRAYMCDRG